MSLHKVLLKLHLWTGLASAVFLIILGVTGSILEFAPEVAQQQVRAIQPGARPLPMTELMTSLQKSAPGSRLRTVFLGTRPSEPYRFFAVEKSAGKRGQQKGYIINQYTGQILQILSPEVTGRFMASVRRLHTSLWAGRPGALIVNYATLVSLFLILTGIILWWPRKIWRITKGGSWRRFNFDLHQMVGLYSMVFFFIIAFTGVMIHWQQISRWIVAMAHQETADLRGIRSSPPAPGAKPLTLEQLLAKADATLPGSRTTVIALAERPADPVVVFRMRSGDDPLSQQIACRLDQFSGTELAVDDPATRPWAIRLTRNVVTIHEGMVFGWAGRIIAAVTSTAVPVMVITGFIIWWRRKLTEWRRRASREGFSPTAKQLEDEAEDNREDLDLTTPSPTAVKNR